MKLSSLLCTALAGMFSVVVPAIAEGRELYRHNGSIVEMTWDDEVGEWFEIRYVRPRQGLNINPGTLLLSGGYPASGDVYAYAYTFKRGCTPAEYRLEGHFDGDDLYLSGKAPIRERSGCRVIRYGYTNNSSLVFIRLK